jgi:hypothetical protein
MHGHGTLDTGYLFILGKIKVDDEVVRTTQPPPPPF